MVVGCLRAPLCGAIVPLFGPVPSVSDVRERLQNEQKQRQIKAIISNPSLSLLSFEFEFERNEKEHGFKFNILEYAYMYSRSPPRNYYY